jgi:GNAT superfamily N-acetyltransferase
MAEMLRVLDPLKSTIVRSNTAAEPMRRVRVVTLRDGTRVRLRPIRPDDEEALVALFERLSVRTVYQRFFAPYPRLPRAWYRDFANVDYERRFGLVAERFEAEGPRLLGVAQWEPGDAPDVAELALLVEDAWQGRGLGVLLFEELLRIARSRGYRMFTADVLAENQRMLNLLRATTTIVSSSIEQGVMTLRFVPAVSCGSYDTTNSGRDGTPRNGEPDAPGRCARLRAVW